jgi:hypothetical protein
MRWYRDGWMKWNSKKKINYYFNYDAMSIFLLKIVCGKIHVCIHKPDSSINQLYGHERKSWSLRELNFTYKCIFMKKEWDGEEEEKNL